LAPAILAESPVTTTATAMRIAAVIQCPAAFSTSPLVY
jgi:hypothetical protein